MLRTFTVVFCCLAFAGFSLGASCQEQAQPQAINHPSKVKTPAAATASAPKNPITVVSPQTDILTPNQPNRPATVRVLLPAKDRYDYFLLGLNTVLAAVGVVGLLLASKNLKKISVQTNEIKRQADLAEKELEILVRSSEATMVSADATRASVELTQKNMDLYLAKESAKLGISAESVARELLSSGDWWLRATCIFTNYGSSNARVMSSDYQFYVSNLAKPSFASIATRYMELPKIIRSSDDARFGVSVKVTQPEYDEFRAKRNFLHLCVTIRYEDIFGRVRTGRAEYIWREEVDNTYSAWEDHSRSRENGQDA